MNKYGIEHFHIEQIEECDYSIVNEREEYWIEFYNSFNNGYNATTGGDGKTLYDYNLIAEKYKELKCIKDVANYFGCDHHTVAIALKNTNTYILTRKEVAQMKQSKKIAMIDLQTNEILHTFNSIREAAIFLGNSNKAPHISKVCKGIRNSAYGYK